MRVFLEKALVEPVRNNVASVFFWGGGLFVFVGAIFGDKVDNFSIVPEGTGEALLNGGGAVLGAGVFAIIMKSAQFSEVFQRHIFDVFFHPENAVSGVRLQEKWKDITSALLREVLPKSHLTAADEIYEQFFSSDMEYHFENYYNSYTINIDEVGSVASIEILAQCDVVLSPHSSDPFFTQSVVSDRDVELKALRFNGADALVDNQFVKDKENYKKDVLKIPLKKYAKISDNGDQIVRLERVTTWTQDLSMDPYIINNINKYIKGATIRAKVSSGFKLHFERYGLGGTLDNNYLSNDGEGYERWELAEPGGMLLPGQGYFIVIMPEFD